MTHPDGYASLAVRERYLRRRRTGRFGDRSLRLWLGLAAVVSWLGIAGFAGLAH